MARIIPIFVSDSRELAQAIELERSAIVVKNKKMYQELQKREKKSKARKNGSKIGAASSAVVGLTGIALAIAGPVGWFGAALGITATSLLTLCGSALAGVDKSKLDSYQISFNKQHELMILRKIKGKNAIEMTDDVII